MLLLFAILGMMAVQYTYLVAISFTNSGTATVLQYIGPAFVLLYVCLRNRRWPHWRELVSLIAIMIGVFLIATHGDIGNLVISQLGLIWGIASAIFLAVHDVMPVKLIQRWGSLPVTAWAMFLGGIALAIITRPFDYVPTINVDTVLTFSGLIIIGTVFGFTAFLTGVSHIGPVKASLVCCIEPIAASFFSFQIGRASCRERV